MKRPGIRPDNETPRGAGRTSRRFAEKTAKAAAARAWERMQPEMAARYQAEAVLLAAARQAACAVTDSAGVATWQRFWSQTFALEVFKLWRKRQRREIPAELELLREKWRVRSLDPELLKKVAEAVMSRPEKGASDE